MEAAGIHIRSCQSNKVKEVKEEEEDYLDNKEEEAATLPNLEFPAFTSFIGQGLYNVVSKPIVDFASYLSCKHTS